MKNKEKQLENIISIFSDVYTTHAPIGFNIFPAISDTFYQENFHSDILKSFLSTNSGSHYLFGAHYDGDLYLQKFIDMLNDKRSERQADNLQCIKGNLYNNAIVEREPHRIDILIKGDGHCIIIENKINDAPDMEKQISRYHKSMEDEGFIVDAVVYLTKTSDSFPNTSSWSLSEKKSILPKVIVIPANDVDGNISLLNSWIKPCSLLAKDPNCESSLRQYGDLIEYLTPDFKKVAAMNRLLEYLQEYPSDIKNAIIPDGMMRELPGEMALQLRESVRGLISSKGLSFEVGQWQPNSCVINLDASDNKIWIYCSANETSAYKLGFRGRWHDFDTTNYCVNWYPMSASDVEVAVDQNGAYLAKDFKFGKEGKQELLNFISTLLEFADKANV